ncbi:MAG: hypothetical protein AAGI11_15340 [Pseudomonadota bacterium]
MPKLTAAEFTALTQQAHKMLDRADALILAARRDHYRALRQK